MDIYQALKNVVVDPQTLIYINTMLIKQDNVTLDISIINAEVGTQF